MALLRFETLFAVLLVGSITVIAVNELHPREQVLSLGDDWVLRAGGDAYLGGSSEVEWSESEDGIHVDYEIKDDCGSPYITLSLVREDYDVLDLSWAENVRVRCRSASGERYFKLQLRNFEPGFSDYRDATTWKYNESLIRPSNEFQTIEVAQGDFSVPLWWSSRHEIAPAEALPRFDRIQSLEFTTMGKSGRGYFEFSDIRFVGHFIPTSVLYPALLGLWIGCSLLMLSARVVKLARKLNEERGNQARLVETHERLSSRLQAMALTDSLTGLLNRRGLTAPIESALNDANADTPTTVVMFDVDCFKQLNDVMGHAHGDLVLRELAEIVAKGQSADEVVGRWGGDEFLWLRKNSNLSRTKKRAEALLEQLATAGSGYSCSFGVYELRPGDDIDTMMECVDQALYDAKDAGRNTVCAYGEPRLEKRNKKSTTDCSLERHAPVRSLTADDWPEAG